MILVFRKKGHPQHKDQTQRYIYTERIDTLNTYDNTETRTPVLILENYPNDSRVKIKEDGIVQSLNARMGTGGGNVPMLLETENTGIVRRLIPLECERLQCFPDGYTDIGEWKDSKGKVKTSSDSVRYKALGNSLCLPFWAWMSERMVVQLKKDGVENPTMGSLFDGIGGFPLVYSRNGCKPVWASEIEEFPIAVTKKHFPETDDMTVDELFDYYINKD